MPFGVKQPSLVLKCVKIYKICPLMEAIICSTMIFHVLIGNLNQTVASKIINSSIFYFLLVGLF
jgi:hypothetical protein